MSDIHSKELGRLCEVDVINLVRMLTSRQYSANHWLP